MICGGVTYLCLAASTGSDNQTAVALATNDRTLQQIAELLVCSIVRGRVVLAIHLDLIDFWRPLQRPQDGAFLTFEQRSQILG